MELILQSGEEFRVDLASELFNVVNGLLQVLLLVASPLLHLEVPRVYLLYSLRTEDERGGRDLRVTMLQQERIEQRNLTQILSKEEDLIV